MAKDTTALRDFKIGDEPISKGADLSKLPANQLRDFQAVGLVGDPNKDAPTPATPAA